MVALRKNVFSSAKNGKFPKKVAHQSLERYIHTRKKLLQTFSVARLGRWFLTQTGAFIMSKKTLQNAHEEIVNLLNLIKCEQDMELDLNKITDSIIQAVIAATTSADNVLAELTVDARKRALYSDSVDGFKARRAAYRSCFEKLNGQKPIVGSDDDYRVTDFLAEEWGDLIANKMLKPTVLAARDYRLYRALVEYVRSVRRGRHDRVPDESISVTDLLTEPKKSVRQMLDVYESRPSREQSVRIDNKVRSPVLVGS